MTVFLHRLTGANFGIFCLFKDRQRILQKAFPCCRQRDFAFIPHQQRYPDAGFQIADLAA
ncbi:hypothetical protein D3C79_1088390 [compost metagenome]